MLLLSLSKVGLNKMLDICNTYSSMWRFEYNPSKCNVVSFNSSPKEQNTDWLLGHDIIPVADVYKHLGLELDKYLSMTEAVTEACRKLKSTFFSITKSGLIRLLLLLFIKRLLCRKLFMAVSCGIHCRLYMCHNLKRPTGCV